MSDPKLTAILKANKLRLTPQRELIFTTLAHHSPLSNARLGDLLEDELDRATVYRTLELYEQLGITKRVWIGWKSQIELSETFVPHHHHAVCKKCGAHLPIESHELEDLVHRLAANIQFRMQEHTLDLVGYCRDCI